MVFRLVTWVVVSLAGAMALNYYNTVERPDLEMPAAMAQFDNSDEAAKKLRTTTYVNNNVNGVAIVGWFGYTAWCFLPPINAAMKRYVQESGD
jgi:hypothetical protein